MYELLGFSVPGIKLSNCYDVLDILFCFERFVDDENIQTKNVRNHVFGPKNNKRADLTVVPRTGSKPKTCNSTTGSYRNLKPFFVDVLIFERRLPAKYPERGDHATAHAIYEVPIEPHAASPRPHTHPPTHLFQVHVLRIAVIVLDKPQVSKVIVAILLLRVQFRYLNR